MMRGQKNIKSPRNYLYITEPSCSFPSSRRQFLTLDSILNHSPLPAVLFLQEPC